MPKCAMRKASNNGKQTDRKKTVKVGSSTIFFAYIFAFLFPPFGFISGLVLIARKRVKHGLIVIFISIAVLMLIAIPMYI